MHRTSTLVSTLSQIHLLYTDPTLSRQIQNLAVNRGDLDFLKYLVNNLRIDINGEHCDCYLYGHTHASNTYVIYYRNTVVNNNENFQGDN